MRALNTLTRLTVALWIAVLLNGAIIAAFDHAATQAREYSADSRQGHVA